MGKVISICGVERGDFPYYTAALLAKSGKTVLVIDNSYVNDVFRAITNGTENDDIALRQNITYMHNIMYNKEYDDVYDFIIVWHGMNIKTSILEQSDSVYVLPDYTPECLISISNRIQDKNIVTAVYMRDAVENTKISDMTAMSLMSVEKSKLRFVVGYDGKDYENYLSFLYNGRQTFANLTPNYSNCLKSLVAGELEIDQKQANKLYKKTRKAKTFI